MNITGGLLPGASLLRPKGIFELNFFKKLRNPIVKPNHCAWEFLSLGKTTKFIIFQSILNYKKEKKIVLIALKSLIAETVRLIYFEHIKFHQHSFNFQL